MEKFSGVQKFELYSKYRFLHIANVIGGYVFKDR